MGSLLYFFWISLTMTACLAWSLRRAHQKKFPLDLYFKVTGWMLITIPLGARLFHVFYEEPQYYAEDPIRILQIWNGGFVYYGGLLLGTAIIFLLFLKPRERNFWETADFFAPFLAFGTGLGRIACLIQGCCYGRELHQLWAIRDRHPTQLYIFIWEMLLVLILFKIEKFKPKVGSLFLFWIGASAFGRFVIEYFRDDFRGAMVFGLSISQMISLGLLFASSILIIQKNRVRNSG